MPLPMRVAKNVPESPRASLSRLAAAAASLFLSSCVTSQRDSAGEVEHHNPARHHMAGERAVPVPAPFRSVDDVAAGLEHLKEYFVAHRDRRGVFAITYWES